MLGFLNVIKPKGITAHDAVARLRKVLKIKHIGHGGTLDPMATGILPIGIGNACRLFRFLQSDKIYRAEILFGLKTATDDVEGAVISALDRAPDLDHIVTALKNFQGDISQRPPVFSAIHVGGKRLYELARQNKAPAEIAERAVTIFSVELIEYKAPILALRIHCSAGTYIRSIARDLGEQLDCGGCLYSLVREKAGRLMLDSAKTLEEIQEVINQGALESILIPPQAALPLLNLPINQEQTQALRHGRSIFIDCNYLDAPEQHVLVSWAEAPIAICRMKPACSEKRNDLPAGLLIELRPEVVLNNDQP